MKLRFITGRSGSGKSEFISDEIIKVAKESPEKNVIYIVPEQFSLQAERNLIEKSNSKTILNAQVLSFKRLAYHVFAELGQSSKPLLDEISKAVLLRKILNENIESFLYFNKGICKKQGFIEKIGKTISEFFQYCITPKRLEELIAELEKKGEVTNTLLKLKDIRLIYESYTNYLAEEYISSDETLDFLSEKISASKLVSGSIFYIDGFNGFTPQEFKVLEQLFKVADRVTVALTLTSSPNRIGQIESFDPYYDSKNTIRRLSELAKAGKATIEPPLRLEKNLRHKNNKELAHLEDNYFKYPYVEYNAETENITILSASNKYREINKTAVTINNLIKDNSYKYSDIAIILPNEEYKSYLFSTLDRYKIPYFADGKTSIKNHSLTELVCSVLDIIRYNFSYESVFSYIKTGFLEECSRYDITRDSLNMLENYVLANGINSYRWKQGDWIYGFGGYSKFNQTEINEAKNIFLKSIEPISLEKNKAYSVKYISKCLMDFLINLEVPQSLAKRNMALGEEDVLIKKENIQVWKSITFIIDNIVKILAEEEMTVNEYAEILNSAFENTKAGFIPSSQDQLIIGDFGHTRLPKIKALFVLNVNDGVLPAIKNDFGFIDDAERKLMAENGVELAPDSRRLLSQDSFIAYTMLTKPTEKLFLSYSNCDLSGDEIKPSMIIDNINNIFPKVRLVHNNILTKLSYEDINAIEPAFELLVNNIKDFDNNLKEDTDQEEKEKNNIIKDIYLYFSQNESYKERLAKIEKGLFKLDPKERLNSRSIQALYPNKTINLSISKLEAFNACPFSYFLKYGLKAEPRESYQIGNDTLGSFKHLVLENFSNILEKKAIDWHNVTVDEVDSFIDEAIEKALNATKPNIFEENARNIHLVENIRRCTKLSAYILIEHIKLGEFNPYGFEFSLKETKTDAEGNPIEESRRYLKPVEIKLDNGYKILLNGKIDRIDIMDKNDNVYVNIIDYKSRNHSFELENIYFGVQVQLILYLDAFIKLKGNDKEFKDKFLEPSGVFYFGINDPTLTIKNGTDKLIDDKGFFEKYVKNAILSSNPEVLKGLDKSLDDKSEDSCKAADFKHFKPILFGENYLLLLMKYVNYIIKKSADKMLSGNIDIYPYKNDSKEEKIDACRFCNYSQICSLDIIDKKTYGEDSKYNVPKVLPNEKYIEKMLECLNISADEFYNTEENAETDKLIEKINGSSKGRKKK